jgi:pyruvate formate lyase activating enzyme
VVPGWNDSDAELGALTAWIVANLGPAVPWHVSRFFPAHRMLDVPPTPTASLIRAAGIGRAAGLRYVYVGNAPGLGLEDTRCAGCDRVVIARSGYRTRSQLTAKGACPACGRGLEGIGLDGASQVDGRRGAPAEVAR